MHFGDKRCIDLNDLRRANKKYEVMQIHHRLVDAQNAVSVFFVPCASVCMGLAIDLWPMNPEVCGRMNGFLSLC